MPQIGFTETLTNAVALALEKYQSEGTRPNNLLGRFPMRNRFISVYIFKVTGKQRTPKQVGSRLQQMRDTCRGGPSMSISPWFHHYWLTVMLVLELVSGRFSCAEAKTMTESSSEGSCHAPQTPYKNASSRDHPTVVYVEISLQLSTSPVPVIHFQHRKPPHHLFGPYGCPGLSRTQRLS